MNRTLSIRTADILAADEWMKNEGCALKKPLKAIPCDARICIEDLCRDMDECLPGRAVQWLADPATGKVSMRLLERAAEALIPAGRIWINPQFPEKYPLGRAEIVRMASEALEPELRSRIHAGLARLGAKWLKGKRRALVTLIEPHSGREPTEIPDVLGFASDPGSGHWMSMMIECKASRSDFLADLRKTKARTGELRWYLCPEGMLDIPDMPPGWGLLWESGGRIEERLAPQRAQESVGTLLSERDIAVAMLRRFLGTGPVIFPNDSIRGYNGSRFYGKDWMNDVIAYYASRGMRVDDRRP